MPGILEQVYDFIYRLTSRTVHFNPELLLKQGWGTRESEEALIVNSRFSSKNMGAYHLAVCQIYGSYLLILYFELFDDILQPNQQERDAVAELRNHIWQDFRWPEMVTFEEMNQVVPDPKILKWPNSLVYSLYSVAMQEGFIAGAKEILEGIAVKSRSPNKMYRGHDP